MTFYELNILLENLHNFNIISAWKNTASCSYRLPEDDDDDYDDEHLFVGNISRII